MFYKCSFADGYTFLARSGSLLAEKACGLDCTTRNYLDGVYRRHHVEVERKIQSRVRKGRTADFRRQNSGVQNQRPLGRCAIILVSGVDRRQRVRGRVRGIAFCARDIAERQGRTSAAPDIARHELSGRAFPGDCCGNRERLRTRVCVA